MRRNESISHVVQQPGKKVMTPTSSAGGGSTRSSHPGTRAVESSMSTVDSIASGTTSMSGVTTTSPGLSRSGSTSQLMMMNGGTTTMPRPGDKTVCEYCGVSYMTMNAMRTLQAKVKEQDEKITQLKEAVTENVRMKDTLGNIRKTHRKEINKRDEECQRWVFRCTAVENELDGLKKTLQECQGKNADLAQKYAIASEDFKQQEELISQLRSKLQSDGDMEAENITLQNKNKSLEDNLQKLLQEIKSLRSAQSAPSKTSTQEGLNTTEAALKVKLGEMTERCNRLSAENSLYQEELLAILQNQEKNANNSQSVENAKSSKMPSVVSVEVHDLKRENSILNSRLQAVLDEHSNCQDMHAFLRESIEKLKSDNARLVEEMNGLKVKYEESLLKVENFQVVISGYQAERNRFMASYKEQQNKLEQMAAQNRAFHKSCDPKMIEQLKSNITTLERQIQSMEVDKEKQRFEFEGKLAQVQREVIMEKEKVDSCLTQGLTEREEVEKRWQERWARHHSKLTDQLEILKTNYDGSLKCSKEREDALQKEIHHLQEKMNKAQKIFEEHKTRLNEKIEQWKQKHTELEEELQNTVKGKVDVEVMFQEKTQQLEELHEAVRQGCEERQDLQRRAEELERSIQETAANGGSNSNSGGSVSTNSTVLIYPSSVETNLSTLTPQNSTSLLVVESSDTTNAAASVVWKQSQNFNLKKQQQPSQQQQQQQQQNTPVSSKSGTSTANTFEIGIGTKQRPNSPFPLLGGKSSTQTFTVGMGKNTKTGSTSSFKEKSNSSSKKNLVKNSDVVIFSVAAPSRKSNRH